MNALNVLKFGGTSVGSVKNLRNVAEILKKNQNSIVVVSALSGTTNLLVALDELLKSGNKPLYKEKLKTELSRYYDFIDDLFNENANYAEKVKKLIIGHFELLESLAHLPYQNGFEKQILAQGELMSSLIITNYMNSIGHESYLLSALNFMRINDAHEPDLDYIRFNLQQNLLEFPDNAIVITQGFICRNAYGAIDNLKRGGSDYTATLIGAALELEKIEIWTDIDGVHNNDPRIVKNTHPIERLSYDEAAELAYFGAKILHPSCVLPAREANVPLYLKNTEAPEAFGTLITKDNASDVRIRAIAAKDGITVVKIKSDRMLMAYGFLRRVFEVFERFETPIDMISTSEVAVSLTIDNASNLGSIIEELRNFGDVQVEQNQAIVCVVGKFSADEAGIVSEVVKAISDVPIRMISYGGSNYNISLLVRQEDKNTCLNQLNEALFEFNSVVR